MFAAIRADQGRRRRDALAAAAGGSAFPDRCIARCCWAPTTRRCARRCCTTTRARMLEARELAERHPALAREVGVKPMAGFTAPKLMWLQRHEPETRARVRTVLLPKDYLRFVLTGEKRIDMSDAAGTWWLDEAARRWSAAALAASGVDPALMPALVEGSQAGRPASARARRRTRPSPRRRRRGGGRRRGGRRGRPRRDPAGRRLHLAGHGDAS